MEGDFTSTYDTLIKSLEVLPDVFIYSHGDMVFKKKVYEELLKTFKKNHFSTISLMNNNDYQIIKNEKNWLES